MDHLHSPFKIKHPPTLSRIKSQNVVKMGLNLTDVMWPNFRDFGDQNPLPPLFVLED